MRTSLTTDLDFGIVPSIRDRGIFGTSVAALALAIGLVAGFERRARSARRPHRSTQHGRTRASPSRSRSRSAPAEADAYDARLVASSSSSAIRSARSAAGASSSSGSSRVVAGLRGRWTGDGAATSRRDADRSAPAWPTAAPPATAGRAARPASAATSHTRPDSRDAPHLFGLGLKEMLADEITTDLRAIREPARRSRPSSPGQPVDAQPARQGDQLRHASPPVPTARSTPRSVEGVDPDLRVRPFFAQGGTISIREFLVGAFNAEMGLESPDPDLLARPRPARSVDDARGHGARRARKTPSRRRRCRARPTTPTTTASPTRSTQHRRLHGVLPAQLLQAGHRPADRRTAERGHSELCSRSAARPATSRTSRSRGPPGGRRGDRLRSRRRATFNRLFATASPRFVDGRRRQRLPAAQEASRGSRSWSANIFSGLQAPRPGPELPRAQLRRHDPHASS